MQLVDWPVLIVILFGGFIINFVWCVTLIIKNGTWAELLGRGMANQELTPALGRRRLSLNFLFCAIAGFTWYLQFFFYGMGTTQLGKYEFSSWTLHMAFIIVLILSIVIIGWGNTLAGGA